jgi:hypothetical protein
MLTVRPKQTEDEKKQANKMLKSGGFETFHMSAQHVIAEQKSYARFEDFEFHSKTYRFEEFIETLLLLWWTIGGRMVFEVCDQDGRAFFRGDGTWLLDHRLIEE